MLNTETNTPAMARRVAKAFRLTFGEHRRIQTDFEHGQWWVTERGTGAQWAVNDCDGGIAEFDFEQVSFAYDE